jgi:hypothetical protein
MVASVSAQAKQTKDSITSLNDVIKSSLKYKREKKKHDCF